MYSLAERNFYLPNAGMSARGIVIWVRSELAKEIIGKYRCSWTIRNAVPRAHQKDVFSAYYNFQYRDDEYHGSKLDYGKHLRW